MITFVNRDKLNHPIAKTLVILLFLGAIAAWIFWPRGFPPPQEKDRVINIAGGYSIIVPPGFEARTGADPASPVHKDYTHLRPIKPQLWEPGLNIVRYRRPPDEQNLREKQRFHDSTFQGQPALEFDGAVKKYWVHSFVFHRNGEVFQIDLSLPDYFNYTKNTWRPYAESFRYPDPNWTPPTTLPADLKFHTGGGEESPSTSTSTTQPQ
jgi:hypothetical protein